MIEARKNPEYLWSLIRAVKDFRAALVDLLKLYVENDTPTPGVLAEIAPREWARRTDIAQRTKRVARASGLAASASSIIEIGITVQGVGVVDPITAWQTITRPTPLLTPADVLGACDLWGSRSRPTQPACDDRHGHRTRHDRQPWRCVCST